MLLAGVFFFEETNVSAEIVDLIGQYKRCAQKKIKNESNSVGRFINSQYFKEQLPLASAASFGHMQKNENFFFAKDFNY